MHLVSSYKELMFPRYSDLSEEARASVKPLETHGLHIWPRGTHFVMALANRNGSFTGTIYCDREGSDTSFKEVCVHSGHLLLRAWLLRAWAMLSAVASCWRGTARAPVVTGRLTAHTRNSSPAKRVRQLNSKEKLRAFFEEHYKDAIPLLGGHDAIASQLLGKTEGALSFAPIRGC
jgi:hypothetical protein